MGSNWIGMWISSKKSKKKKVIPQKVVLHPLTAVYCLSIFFYCFIVEHLKTESNLNAVSEVVKQVQLSVSSERPQERSWQKHSGQGRRGTEVVTTKWLQTKELLFTLFCAEIKQKTEILKKKKKTTLKVQCDLVPLFSYNSTDEVLIVATWGRVNYISTFLFLMENKSNSWQKKQTKQNKL